MVHTAVITEPGSGVSRGFGFVHIPDPIAARAARDALDNHQVCALVRLDCKLRVVLVLHSRCCSGCCSRLKLFCASFSSLLCFLRLTPAGAA